MEASKPLQVNDPVIFVDVMGKPHHALAKQLWHDAGVVSGHHPGLTLVLIEVDAEDTEQTPHIATHTRVPHISKRNDGAFYWTYPGVAGSTKVPAATEVTMGNGEAKRADQIKPGDQIQTPTGPTTVAAKATAKSPVIKKGGKGGGRARA